MRSRPHITDKPRIGVLRIGGAAAVLFCFVVMAAGQRLAIITPDNSVLDRRVLEVVTVSLSSRFRVLDNEMTRTAFESTKSETPFNMTTDDARRVGSVVGSDLVVLLRTGTQRRAALNASDYVEGFAAVYVVSSRTGRLVKWQLVSVQAQNSGSAEDDLVKAAAAYIGSIVSDASTVASAEANQAQPPAFDEVPDLSATANKDYRAPVPYRRIKPEYTRTAYFYDITATVEMTVFLDEKGQIVHSEITRWAGYGLDESVFKTVTSMNWRPAERGGKPLPSRFLLRYNFRKIEKDDIDNE